MTKISVSESLARRQSIREYIQQDVSPELVIDILETAGKSPSGGNLQPWRVHALSGEVKNILFQKILIIISIYYQVLIIQKLLARLRKIIPNLMI